MADNIYKVEKESDLNEILLDKQDGLVVVMFTDHLSLDKTILRQMRLNIFELSQMYADVFFVYIDLQKFDEINAQHTKDIKIPRFTFYYKCDDFGNVEGMDMDVFAQTLQKVAGQIRAIISQRQEDETKYNTISQNETQSHGSKSHNETDLVHESVQHNDKDSQPNKIGTSLRSLKNKHPDSVGVENPSEKIVDINQNAQTLINSQTITNEQAQPNIISSNESPSPNNLSNESPSPNNLSKDDFQDLLQMKQFLTNSGQKVDFDQLLRVYNNMKQQKLNNTNKSDKLSIQSPHTDNDKQNKIAKIQELTNMQYMMHMSQFKQLEQLKKIKQQKEMQEEEERNSHKL